MHESLPPHLRERLQWLVEPGERLAQGEFVLYWMHNALRAHENPALDVAIIAARELSLPLLVYQGLSEDYPFASDRLHAFILQGHRDAQRALADRGIPSFVHLERQGHRGPHLRDLTKRAALLVSEAMPVEPITGWTHRLANIGSTPIAIVDTSCIVPTPLVKKAYTRAFQYRDSTKSLYEQRIDRGYTEQAVDCAMFDQELPFDPLDLEHACLSSLIGQCNVDHAVAPVADTPGGSEAGYLRWSRFKENGLSRYAGRRNDAATHDGVSRMSAYLHFGMVSPMRIAREANELGADKFLDELLIWREMAFHYCAHQSHSVDSLEGLPGWAQQTLREHEGDPRGDYSWETLARARSGQSLWDACQRSLLKHGELHNNVRMTWGKAFLPWAASPARALELAIDLNHRYALDGRDPSSYGGILWCFGQFDRPFPPEQSVFGSIRQRSCEQHQQRLDMKRYQRVVDRPVASRLPRIAVIGAGLGGLVSARTLVDHGLNVEVFEKSRGVGGRLATRRSPSSNSTDELSFDHGAQYFTARDARFRRYVDSWMEDGLVGPWTGRIVELRAGGEIRDEKRGTSRFVGVPGMNSIAKHLAQELSITQQSLITRIERDGDGKWRLLRDQNVIGDRFDIVIVNCPPPQTHSIIDGHTHIADRVSQAKMRPCWAMMLRIGDTDFDFDGAFINEGPLSWIACNDAKPGRSRDVNGSSWVLHASAEWSEAHLEDEPTSVQKELLAAFESTIGRTVAPVGDTLVHRWRYAIPENPLSEECLWDAEAGIGTCGDWCAGPRVEGAFLSGMAMAGTLLRHLTIDQPAYQEPEKLVQQTLI